jgi:hypothetical protein
VEHSTYASFRVGSQGKVIPGWKGLPGANALAYLAEFKRRRKKLYNIDPQDGGQLPHDPSYVVHQHRAQGLHPGWTRR